MNHAASIEAELFDGTAPRARHARLSLHAIYARVTDSGGRREYWLSALSVSPRLAGAPRFVSLPDGAELLCPDVPLLAALPQQVPSEGVVAWLERRSWVALIAVLLTACTLVFAVRQALPWASSWLASRVPSASERSLGQRTFARLDGSVFLPTELSAEKQASLRRAFAELAADLPEHAGLELEFRRSALGPNALAFPGGPIVLTDALAEPCSTDELTAVLAHELGHVAGRHALRQILTESGTAALAAAVFGDASALGGAGVSVPTLLLDLHTTRDFEREADAFAFDALARHGLSPSLFADALSCLERALPPGVPRSSFLADHPATPERVRSARLAAERFAAQREPPGTNLGVTPRNAP